MSDCQHHDICGLSDEADPEAQLCILHSHNPDKGTQAFAFTLEVHRRDKGDNFRRVVFPERASFSRDPFTKGADFRGATFTEEADFRGATFTKMADFSGATFNDAKFSGATFTEEADFRGARFTRAAIFDSATFLNRIMFDTARFSPRERLSFQNSRFQGRMTFTAGQEASQEEPQDERWMIPVFTNAQPVDFRDVIIEPSHALTFIGADFRSFRFFGTDLRTVQLVGVKWPLQGTRVVVADEIIRVEGDREWDQIERLYRQLKQNYEDQRDYRRAGDFHYGEKEMQRHNPQTPRGARVLLWLYWLISGYGERIGRPLAWSGVLFAMSTCVYLWWGLTPKGTKTPLALNCLWDWITVVHYSFRVMTFLKPTDLAPQGIAKLVHTIQSLLGPLFIGLFALAVRQRLKR